MDFKELMQKMQQIDEGVDAPIEECGSDMPAAIIQGGPSPEESLNMNLTINSKGADGIRELIDVLKGIGGDSGQEPVHHHDDDTEKLFGNDEEEHVIGDSFGNSKHGDRGSKVFNIDAVTPTGDDIFSKGKEAHKQAGGGNPWNIRHESLVNNLASLYEEVKERTQKKT
jgi:hypothetical protein